MNVGASVTPASGTASTAVRNRRACVPCAASRAPRHRSIRRRSSRTDIPCLAAPESDRRAASRCSILIVTSYETPGNRGCMRSTTRRAWVGPLKKSGSPNEMCCAPAANLRAHVGQDDVERNRAERPVIDRDDGTVPAEVLAPACRIGAADGPPAAVRHPQRRIAFERREPCAIGLDEREAWHPSVEGWAIGSCVGSWASANSTSCCLRLRPKDVGHAALPSQLALSGAYRPYAHRRRPDSPAGPDR